MVIENSISATYGYICTTGLPPDCLERTNAESVGENDMETSLGQLNNFTKFQYIPENLDIQSTKSDGYKDPDNIDKELGIEREIFITAWVFPRGKYFGKQFNTLYFPLEI